MEEFNLRRIIMNWKYDDEILFVGNGCGFMACDCLSGVFRAFCDFGIVPGKAIASSGSALFTSIFYSKGIEWIQNMIHSNQPSDFVDILPLQAVKTLYGKSNR